MAEEFTRLVKIGLDKSFINDSIASADKLAVEIDKIKKAKKEEGAITADQEGRLKALTAERNKSIQVLKQANLLTSTQIKGQEKLKAQLSILTANYNKLTTEEQKNTKEGQKLQKNISNITEELKANEKAVGNNRRNVGNYEEALQGVAGQLNVMGVNLGGLATQLKTYKEGVVASAAATKASATATGGFSGALQILKVALISTGIGAFVVALGTMVTFLTQTKRGSELLAQSLSAIGATVSVLTDRMSQLGEALTFVFSGEFDKAAKTAKGAFSGITEEIVKESKAAATLEKRMQGLRDAERELLVETSKRKAEVAELQLIAEDETNTYKERGEAIAKANAIQEANMKAELELQKERVAIIQEQLALGENLEEDEQKLAEERAKLGDIEAANIKKLRTLKAKENSIRNQEHAADLKRRNDAKKLSEQEVKEEQERIEAIEKGYQDERAAIDEAAELKKSQSVINIANAEEQAEAIAFIEREALLEKLRSIEDETVAYTASADAIGSIDEKKYAKQLAERAKYEAELAAIDRAAKAEAFNSQIDLLNGQEQLDIQAAELSIDNERDLQNKKYQIALEFAQKRLALMREEAMLDDVLTEKEKQNLESVENTIKKLQDTLANPEQKTAAQSLGLSEDQIADMQLGLTAISGALQAVQSATQAAADNRITEIDNQAEAEKSAVEKSTLSEEKKKDKIAAIDKKAAKERYKVELAQFKTAKALQIALAVANTATAVMAQMSNPTPYAGIVLAALAAATGAVQIGVVASQKPPPPPAFAKGGYVSGAGTGTSDSIDAKLSNGESVNNARTTAMFAPMLSAMNAAGGGVDWYNGESSSNTLFPKFAAGGLVQGSSAMIRDNQANAELSQTIAQSQPVLVIEDFQEVQGRQIRTEQNLAI